MRKEVAKTRAQVSKDWARKNTTPREKSDRRDRSGDDWSRQQRTDKLPAERSELRQRLEDLEKARRAITPA